MRNLAKWRLTACLLIIIVLLGPTSATGGFFDSLTLEREKQIGEEFFMQLQQFYPISSDPFVTSYINRLGKKLVTQLGPQPYQFRFFVIEDPTMNAFAVPGGYIFVTTGFIRTMEREGELVGVLSHEISHIYARHLARQMDTARPISILTLVGSLAAVLLGGAAAAPILAGTQAAGQAAMLKYSRDHEQEADSLGFKWMMKAGYNPRDMIRVFRKMGKQRWFEGGEIPVYLSTHPDVQSRLVDLSHQYTVHEDKLPTTRDSTEFHYFAMKVEADSGNPNQLLRRATQAILKEPNDPVHYYGKALALSRLERSSEAEAAFQQALKLDPGNIIIQRDLAGHYFDRNRYQEALGILEDLVKSHPRDVVVLYYLGRIYQQRHQTDLALAAMERVYSLNPAFVEVYQNLGMLYGEKGRLGLAHYFLGLHSLRAKAYPTALFHFKKAMANMPAGDPHYSEVRNQIARLQKLKVKVQN